MTAALTVSVVLLWAAVLALALLVLALARQVGVLHERVAPAGALQPTGGPKPGEMTEAMALKALDGRSVTVGGPGRDATFVLFVSPSCPVCRSLAPTALSLAGSEARRMRLVFASDGAETDEELGRHRAYAKELRIGRHPYVISQALGMRYHASRLPFALLIAPDGALAGKGLVNTREHMESLIESMDSGIATVQDYARGLSAGKALEHPS